MSWVITEITTASVKKLMIWYGIQCTEVRFGLKQRCITDELDNFLDARDLSKTFIVNSLEAIAPLKAVL